MDDMAKINTMLTDTNLALVNTIAQQMLLKDEEMRLRTRLITLQEITQVDEE